MGCGPIRCTAMNRICWFLVDVLFRALEHHEKVVVQGDLSESRETGPEALRDVMGLVARRQIALWRSGRPWLVCLVIIVPLGLMLSFLCDRVATQTSLYAWMYFANWDWAQMEYRAFWITLPQTLMLVFPDILAVLCLSLDRWVPSL